MEETSSRNKEAKIDELLKFLNESWTAFHAVAEAKRMLVSAGFEELKEREDYEPKLRRNGAQYIKLLHEVLFVGLPYGSAILKYHNLNVSYDQPYLILTLNLSHDKKGNTFWLEMGLHWLPLLLVANI